MLERQVGDRRQFHRRPAAHQHQRILSTPRLQATVLAPHGTGGAYVNALGAEGAAGVRAAYPERTYERLRAVKWAYDPTNLFRSNHNIPPGDD